MTSKKAELLSKSWLMGVRRGWQSLVKPQINDWQDIFDAFGRLLEFVNNLEDQIKYVRRGPMVSLKDSEEGKVLELKFKALRDAIKDRISTARGWYQEAMGIPPAGGRKDDGLKMFELYKKDFDGILTTYVKTRRNPGKGRYNSEREANIIELLDDVLEILRSEAARLDKNIKFEGEAAGHSRLREMYEDPAFKEFDFGRMRVVITAPGARGMYIQSYIRHIDRAYQLIHAKKLGKLWYGVMFLDSTDYKELTKDEQEAYEKLGYQDLKSQAGVYHSGDDTVRLTAPPSSSLTNTIVHELGHRYWYKRMSWARRKRFNDLVRTNFSEQYREFPPGITEDRTELPGTYLKPVSPVESYGFSSIEEAFATVFAAYVTNEVSAKLNRDQLESFKSVLAAASEPVDVARRVLARFELAVKQALVSAAY